MSDACSSCTDAEKSVCLCRHPEFAFFRDWMAGGDELQQRHVRQRSLLPYTPPPPPPDDDPDCPDQAARKEGVRAAMKWIARMRACPHFEASSECGCGVNRCRLGKGKDGLVSHADCRACLGG